MLQTFQIIALFQGLFLLIVLFKNKSKYIYSNYFYLNCSLISLLFFISGDNNANLFGSTFDFFLVDNKLFITFLFLFLKNFNSLKPIKFFKIVPFFLPVLVYVFIELNEIFYRETYGVEVIEHVLYFVFVIYLIFSFYFTMGINVSIFIKIPFYVLIFSLFLNYSLNIFSFVIHTRSYEILNSILIFEIAFIFYFLSYLFVFNINFINRPIDTAKYKNSSLNEENIETLIMKMKQFMIDEKMYLNPDLSLQTFSDKTTIPKHYISEILNIHLNKTFTQFVNEYRIQEFIKLYTNEENQHYSILGIANSVGFKNKATFNSSFKKIIGISPSEYKKISIE